MRLENSRYTTRRVFQFLDLDQYFSKSSGLSVLLKPGLDSFRDIFHFDDVFSTHELKGFGIFNRVPDLVD